MSSRAVVTTAWSTRFGRDTRAQTDWLFCLTAPAAQLLDSLKRLAALPATTEVYCAHEYTEGNLRFALAVEPGNQALHQRYENVLARRAQGLSTVPSTLALELETNPFLRTDVPEVRIAAQARDPHVLDDATAFAALRAWKNQF